MTRQVATTKGALRFHGYPGHSFVLPSVRVGMGAATAWVPGFPSQSKGEGKKKQGSPGLTSVSRTYILSLGSREHMSPNFEDDRDKERSCRLTTQGSGRRSA